jgi:hypothetical protein
MFQNTTAILPYTANANGNVTSKKLHSVTDDILKGMTTVLQHGIKLAALHVQVQHLKTPC